MVSALAIASERMRREVGTRFPSVRGDLGSDDA
jgi:hypothetical protein